MESTKPDAAITIRVCDQGELVVEGPFRVVDAAGNVLREGNRCSLCRCGHSKTKPFCDNTHESLDVDW
jgi:CDGSH-type Zn-finger protein